LIILYEIVCFHLVFSFCVDLVGMVKIMQKHAKLEQEWKKIKNQENCRNSRLDVVPSRLDHQKLAEKKPTCRNSRLEEENSRLDWTRQRD